LLVSEVVILHHQSQFLGADFDPSQKQQKYRVFNFTLSAVNQPREYIVKGINVFCLQNLLSFLHSSLPELGGFFDQVLHFFCLFLQKLGLDFVILLEEHNLPDFLLQNLQRRLFLLTPWFFSRFGIWLALAKVWNNPRLINHLVV